MSPPHDFPPGLTPLTDTDPQHVSDYRVVGRLGSGGMGTVFAALNAADTPVALKVVHGEYAADQEFRARFDREVTLLRRVVARCVPAFYEADTSDRRPWLATEYVPGRTLRAHVAEHGPFTGDLLMGLAAGMAEALVAIHGTGVVHRDLKPGNVIIAPDGPKVLDFGIARAIEESAITRTGGLLGTPGWIAPEQYQGAEPAAPSDLFAWGGLVAFAATGRNPFGSGATDALAYRTMEEDPDLEGLPEALQLLVTAALSKDPAQRPSAEQALSEVTRVWTGQAPSSGAEATRVLPGMLDSRWTGLPEEESGTALWSAHAPARRSGLRSPKVLVPVAAVVGLALIVTASLAFWQFSAGTDGTNDARTDGGTDEGGGTDDGDSEDEGGDPAQIPDMGHGGPDLGENEATAPIDFSRVSTQFVFEGEGAESVQVEVAEELTDGTGLDRSEPVLRLNYTESESTDDGVRFAVEAEYLLDSGTYTLHSQDFRYRDALASEWTPEEPEDALYPEEDEALLTLDTENPIGAFEFTVPGAVDYGGIQYVTPELWGYQPQLPDDPVPGHICYNTGGDFQGPHEHLGCEEVGDGP